MEQYKTLAQALYSEIEGDYLLRYLYQKLLVEYGTKTLSRTQEIRPEIDLEQILTYSDLLSKSTHETRSEIHKCWAQELVLLLKALYPENKYVEYYLGSILSSISNFRGLSIEAKGYASYDFFDRLFDEYKKNKLRIRTEQGKYFFEPQKRIIEGFEGANFSFSAPTSLGKSFVMNMFIKDKIISGAKLNFAVIVPSRALINEVTKSLTNELKDLLSSNSYKIVNSAGASALEEGGSNFIFVMTPERFLYLMILRPTIDVEYLFIDEAHKISKGDERSTFYYQIVGIQSQLPHRPHIVFSSPLIPNPEVFLSLLRGRSISDSDKYRSTFSPVCQEKLLVDLKKKACFIYDEHHDEMLEIGQFDGTWIELVKSIGKDKRSIVYIGSKNRVVEYAKFFAEELDSVDDDALRELAEFIRTTVHDEYYLAELVEKGVAFHNGALPLSIRTRIEDLFRDPGESFGIRTLFCTSTLLEGVNLPADNLFVMDYTNGSKTPMSGVEFRNLIGRVGRIKYNLYGNVVFTCIPNVSTKDGFHRLLKAPIVAQTLSAESSLSPIHKKIIADSLKNLVFELPREIASSSEEYSMLRKFTNIILGDIIKCRDSYLLQEFSEYLTKEDMYQIRERFGTRSENLDEDINLSYDQNESLQNAIRDGMKYPEVVPGRKIDFNVLYSFLVWMCKVFKWRVYESKTLGYFNDKEGEYTKLKLYTYVTIQWVSGQSVHDIIANRITKYNYKTKEDINRCITDVFDIIENVIQFSLSNYFLKFSSAYRKAFPDVEFCDWYEYLEYGSTDGRCQWLQRNGFSRDSALFITRNNKKYIDGDGETLRVRGSVFGCKNINVVSESKQVYYNNKDLFLISKDEIDLLNTILNNDDLDI